MQTSLPEHCCCGAKMHFGSAESESLVVRMMDMLGVSQQIRIAGWAFAYEVPRYYTFLHDVDASNLEALAERYSWPRVELP